MKIKFRVRVSILKSKSICEVCTNRTYFGPKENDGKIYLVAQRYENHKAINRIYRVDALIYSIYYVLGFISLLCQHWAKHCRETVWKHVKGSLDVFVLLFDGESRTIEKKMSILPCLQKVELFLVSENLRKLSSM